MADILAPARQALDRFFGNTLAPGLGLARPAVVTWTEGAAVDPATGQLAGGTARSVSAGATTNSYNAFEILSGATRSGVVPGGIKATDRKILLDAKPFAQIGPPPAGARIAIDGATYVVRHVEPIGVAPLPGAAANAPIEQHALAWRVHAEAA